MMVYENEITQTIIVEVQRAIIDASHDYFVWSRGDILYDAGVEMLMQVYAAKRLFDNFSQRHDTTVHLERKIRTIVPSMKGRVDMSLQIDGALYIIEFKRYSNPEQITPDLARLREITAAQGGVGLFAAPCYMKVSEGEKWDWPLRYKNNHANNSSQKWHLSEPKKLPDAFKHNAGWSHARALVIEALNSQNA